MRHREPGGSIVLLQLRKKYLSKLIYCLLIIARRACHRVKLSSVGVSRPLVCATVGIASRTAHPQPSSQNVRGLPTWVQWRAGEPRMTLYSNSNGKWAVTQPEHVGRHDARWLAACCFFFLMARRALLFLFNGAPRAASFFFGSARLCGACARSRQAVVISFSRVGVGAARTGQGRQELHDHARAAPRPDAARDGRGRGRRVGEVRTRGRVPCVRIMLALDNRCRVVTAMVAPEPGTRTPGGAGSRRRRRPKARRPCGGSTPSRASPSARSPEVRVLGPDSLFSVSPSFSLSHARPEWCVCVPSRVPVVRRRKKKHCATSSEEVSRRPPPAVGPRQRQRRRRRARRRSHRRRGRRGRRRSSSRGTARNHRRNNLPTTRWRRRRATPAPRPAARRKCRTV